MSESSREQVTARDESAPSKILPLTCITLLLLLLPLVGVSYHALVAFERKLLPEIEKKVLRVGWSMIDNIQRALDFGIPFTKLEGMTEFFAAKLEAAQDIAYVAVTASDGQVLYRHGALADSQRSRLAADTQDAVTAQAAVGQIVPRHRLPAALEGLFGARAVPPAPSRPADGDDYYRIALPIRANGAFVGALHLGIDARIVIRQIEAIGFDIAVVLLVATLMAFELLLLVAISGIAEPLRQLDALLRRLGRGDFSRVLAARDRLGRLGRALNALVEHINARYHALSPPDQAAMASPEIALAALRRAGLVFADGERPRSERAASLIPVRAAAFLFVFAEELARPFFPVYARALAAPIAGWPPEFLVGASISIFMLVMAFTMPVVGVWSNRIGHRNLFLLGASLSTVGLVGTGWAFSYWDLLGWRMLSAFGYTLTFASCQGYVLDNTDPTNRTQGVAMFAGGIATADICGPAIGGILAERIGYGATFAVGAALAVSAALLVARFIPHYLPHRQRHGAGASAPRRGGLIAALLRDPRFLVLMAFAAVPAKLLLTGFLFFLVPVLLTDLGASQSEIGRIAMCYGIATVLCMPLFARLTDRLNAPGFMVGVGCTLAGLGLLPVLFAPGPATVWLAVVGLGVGQALSISAQVTLLTLVCQDTLTVHGAAPVMGVYRFIERLGSAAGPFVAVAFANAFGHAGAALALGVLATVSATLFSVSFLVLGVAPEAEDTTFAASP